MVISMERWVGKVAIVTGASAGIGAAIAEQLVEAGLKVVGLARRKEKIQELSKKLEGKKGKLYAYQTDMAKEEDILKAFQWVKDSLGPVHILVNSADFTRDANLTEADSQLWKEVFDTNVLGLCIATREAIKHMRENNVTGHIIHINSVVGHYVPNLPHSSVYPASKHAVTALTETLRQELNSIGSKIKITSVSPGFVNTEFVDAAYKGSGTSPTPALKELLQTLPGLQASDIADGVLYVLATPPHVQVHELMIRPVGEPF
ncbi:hypothetical protein ILUMI_12584 [Ignelater luminosus]|uniref:Dehydrogenase/reductase SDR family member 11 n=1 Tax=Ignelater luminosus TaxID=2038154 RepID=A0A8K0CTV2_IGNLU|nr:hypothetical protein ILUMI_12584 [Ignelater luminosus]